MTQILMPNINTETSLLPPDEIVSSSPPEVSENLPLSPKTGFIGRRRELEQIETAFNQDGTRRFTISGIGGQGKTCLAIEAGRRLLSTGIFEKVCFIDYTALVGVDAIGLTLKTLASVLNRDLEDIDAATDALNEIPTLLIFDNVETIPTTPRWEFLDVVKQWSEISACRVLLTTDITDFNHFAYPTANSSVHQSLPLSGLAEEDALAYFQRLFEFSPAPQVAFPKPDELLRIFEQVAFHPMAISVLTIPLKIHPPTDLENSLSRKRSKTPDNPLWAALKLSLESWESKVEITGLSYWLARLFRRNTIRRLTFNTQTMWLLPRLGVFQGGAFEPDLLEITDFSKKQWQLLRSILETTGLIQFEFLHYFKVPYIKFHPSLAPALWTNFTSEEEQIKIFVDYQQRYAQLAAYLFYEEGRDTDRTRALARRDLRNLLHAVYSALDANEKWTINFANQVDLFLNTFGFKHDSAVLKQQLING